MTSVYICNDMQCSIPTLMLDLCLMMNDSGADDDDADDDDDDDHDDHDDDDDDHDEFGVQVFVYQSHPGRTRSW